MSIRGPGLSSTVSATLPVVARGAVRAGGKVGQPGGRAAGMLRRRLIQAAQSVVSVFRPEPAEALSGEISSREDLATGLVRVEALIEQAIDRTGDPRQVEQLAMGLSLVTEMNHRLRLCRPQMLALPGGD